VLQLKDEIASLGVSIELIIGDDASTTSFIQKLKQLEDDQCRLLLASENKGREANRLHLAKTAQYNNLLFMDADVLPQSTDFLKKWIEQINQTPHYDVIFGGITYTQERPLKQQLLRWKYGHKYEKQSLENRQKKPYLSLVTGCLLIQKEVFIRHTVIDEAMYGLDILLSYNLMKSKAVVKHIDLPVYHLGLEDNAGFIRKIEESWRLIVDLENRGLIRKDYRSIQQKYLALHRFKLANLLSFLFPLIQPLGVFLADKMASVFWLDVYRLSLFCRLKLKQN